MTYGYDRKVGPWANEPNKHQGVKGLPYVAIRHDMGHWCGYVGIPVDHPYFGKHYDYDWDINVHGGVTYSDETNDRVGLPGQELWWFGFDCAHCGDTVPSMDAFRIAHFPEHKAHLGLETYKTLEFVIEECRSLALQLLDIPGRDARVIDSLIASTGEPDGNGEHEIKIQ